MTDLGYIHRFVPATGESKTPLLLLHGQGGSEEDLLPLGAQLAPGAALLSPRGDTQFQGMTRFFGRLPNGDWDVPDFKARTLRLADFVERAQKAYGLGKLLAVGFSNGSNIGWSLLLSRPDLIKGAILMRSMLPYDPRPLPELPGVPILVLGGARDEVVGSEQPAPLVAALKETGADVTHHTLPTGHRLIEQDIAIAQDWLARHG
jgi:phospholipase/carboxylesterase